MNRQKLSSLILIFTLTIAAFALGISVYAATSPSFDTILEAGSLVSTNRYLIFKEGVAYYARNGWTGAIDYASINASWVISSCITADGEIFFASGDFEITHTIVVDYAVTFRGEGNSSFLYLAQSVNMFNVTHGLSNFYNFGMSGMNLTGIGLFINNVHWCRIENMDIRYFGSDGVYLNGTNSNHWIANNKIVDCWGSAIFMHTVTDTYIIGNDLGGCGEDVIGMSSCAHNVISGNRVYLGGWLNGSVQDAYRGIDLYQCRHETIVGNQLGFNGGSGIRLYQTNFTVVSGNYCYENDQYDDGRAGIIIENSTNNNLAGNTLLNEGGDGAIYNTQDYGILEVDQANNNTITSCNAWNNIVAGIITVGAQTETHSCYNGTSWIT